MKYRSVSTRQNGARDYCGIGNVIIPRDKDKTKYIESCYRKGTISIVLENGGIVDNVIISKSSIKDLQFPDNYTTLGSQVIWINKPKQNQPLVIGIFSKNNDFINTTQDKDELRKASSKGVYEVIVDSSKGIVIVNSSSTLESGGDIYIISTNKTKTSKLSIKVSGSVSVDTPEFNITNSKKLSLTVIDKTIDENITSIEYEKGVGFTYKDEFGNEVILNKDVIQFKPISKLNIGDGAEPLVLGNTLKSNITAEQLALTTLIEAIKSAPVTAGDGGAAFKTSIVLAISAVQRGDYSNILSKIANTD